MFYEWRGYKLRLDAMRVAQLEDKLGGQSPLTIFTKNGEGSMPSLKDLILVLHYALVPYNHGIKLDDAYRIFDEFIAEGNDITHFIPVVIEVFKTSGLIPKDVEINETKN